MSLPFSSADWMASLCHNPINSEYHSHFEKFEGVHREIAVAVVWARCLLEDTSRPPLDRIQEANSLRERIAVLRGFPQSHSDEVAAVGLSYLSSMEHELYVLSEVGRIDTPTLQAIAQEMPTSPTSKARALVKQTLFAAALQENKASALPPSGTPLPVVPRPIGIPNRGNTCFLASVLQAHVLTNPALLKAINRAAAKKDELKPLARFLTEHLAEKHPDVSLLRNVLFSITGNADWLGGRQCDAAEVLRAIRQYRPIQQELGGAPYKETKRYFAPPEGKIPLSLEQGGELFFDESLGAYYYCCPSERFFGDMQIPLVEGANLSVQELVDRFVRNTKPSDGAMYFMTDETQATCSYLGEETSWSKPPERFDLQLKRFEHDQKQNKSRKISDEVVVDERLNLGGAPYQLIGFVVHLGSSLEGGHYISYVRDAAGKYYEMNDEWRTEVTREQFLAAAKKCYTLSYARV